MEKKIKLPKSIKLYLSKKLNKVPSLNLNTSINPNRLRSACKYPKTPSFDKRDPCVNHHTINHAATLSDVNHFLFENFHSLYMNDNDSSSTSTFDKTNGRMHADISCNSVFPSSVTSSPATDEISTSEIGVGIVTFSMDPYEDFKSSMQRMAGAHHEDASQPLDWDFMKELLFCYLELNDKSMHKHILRAFSELPAQFPPKKVSVMSRRTVSVNTRMQQVVDRREMPDSPCAHCAETL
jgi:uncharacterized protein (TIGR01568 family)